jgi:hypothetical protein
VLPCRTAGRPVDLKGEVKLPSARGGRWAYTLSNVQHAEKTGYSLVVTARPLPGLPPGEHTVGRFRVVVRGTAVSAWHEAKLYVQAEPILKGAVSDPQHPYERVQQNWLTPCASFFRVVAKG